MKKLLALGLALLLFLSLCACGSEKSDPVVGVWTLTGLSLNDEDRSSLLNLFDIRLEFRDDGTGTVSSGEESYSITWEDNAFFDGTDTIHYTLEGDSLRFDAEGLTFVFTRS